MKEGGLRVGTPTLRGVGYLPIGKNYLKICWCLRHLVLIENNQGDYDVSGNISLSLKDENYEDLVLVLSLLYHFY